MITVIIIKVLIGGVEFEAKRIKKASRGVCTSSEYKVLLKQRLASFGLIKGANVKVIDCSLGKSTIEIMVDGTLLALRAKEAQQIEVEPIDKE